MRFGWIWQITLQKKEVRDQIFVPGEHFKFCHIYRKRKPMYIVFFSFFISSNFEFYPINALVYVNIDQGIHKVKLKVAKNEKNIYMGFLFL